MRIKRLSWFATTVVFVLTLVSIVTSMLAYHYLDHRRIARMACINAIHASDEFITGIDALTNAVQGYACTGEERYRSQFQAELIQSRSVERALEQLRGQHLTQNELDRFDAAKRDFDAMRALDNRIFDRVREKDLRAARDLVLGEEYRTAKESILASIRRTRDDLQTRLLREAQHHSDMSDRIKIVAFAAYGLNLITVVLVLGWFFQRRVIEPITSLTANTQSIQAGGQNIDFGYQNDRSEVGDLARALNDFRRSEEERSSELHAAKEQLEAIFQSVNVGIVVIRDRVILQCNSKLEEIFGYGPGEFDGKPTRVWYLDEAGYAIGGEPVYSQVARGVTHRREQQLQRKDASTFWARLTVRALDQGDPGKGIVAVVEDITSEREAAEALRLAVEEQGAIFDAATSGIVLIKNRVIVRSNHMMDELFGCGPGEMIGQSTRSWYSDETTFKTIGEETLACLVQGKMFFREQQLVRKDGTLFWGRMTAQAADKTDPSKGLVGMIEDITAERESAEALKDALEAAESADRIKSAFLATMSHELRTPLNSVIGFTGILLQELVGPLNPEQKKQLGMVRNSSNHLLDLINDVLDISKIEAGQLQVMHETIDLNAAIEKTLQSVLPLAQKKGLALSCELPSEPVPIISDRRRVEQILMNLLSNAIKFTEKGGVRLRAFSEKSAMRIEVIDTGIGLSPEDMSHLFVPFSQIDTGLSRKYEGTGLGLSICKRLAELLGGQIWVESVAGQGSTFIVQLPRHEVNP